MKSAIIPGPTNFKKLGDEQIRDEKILRTQKLLGFVVGVDRISKIVRPPGGNMMRAVLPALKARFVLSTVS